MTEQANLLLIQDIATQARHVLLADGFHAPMLAVGESVVLLQPEFAADMKTRREMTFEAGFLLGATQHLTTLSQVILICEAWLSLAQDGKLPNTHPSQDTDRIEVLTIGSINTKSQDTETLIYEMVREEGELVDTKPCVANKNGDIHSPLLNAFVEGFVLGNLPDPDA